MDDNVLYYGDNLDILGRYLADESVDLVYLDPPFNSDASYNVLFAAQGGTRSAAQIQAFEDTWRWDEAAAYSYQRVVEAGGTVSRVMQAFRTFLDESDMLAYLAMMAPRLIDLRRVMRPTGSIYLHCDPTASHYLKMLMDAVFGPQQFFSEIIWRRYGGHGDAKRYGAVHDVILYYGKTQAAPFNKQFVPYDEDYVRSRFRFVDPDGRRWQEQNLVSPSPRPNLRYAYTASNGVTYQPHPNGWKCDLERMKQLDAEGRLHFPAKPGARLRLKMYLDESKGVAVQDLWTDIFSLSGTHAERLGYPTQKPEALLERIIRASSNEGDVVLDPFCGCGTAIAVAQRLKRRWIGIDITHLAVTLMKHRLFNAFGNTVRYKVIGEPTTVQDAEELAREDPYQFQWWALGLVDARPMEGKKGADKGIDGRLYFHDEGASGKTKQIIFSVKAGRSTVAHLRDLRGVLDREGAEIGALITMQEPTQPMRTEAAGAGFYRSPWNGKDYPRLQIRTVAELLAGRGIDYPAIMGGNLTFKKARRAAEASGEQLSL